MPNLSQKNTVIGYQSRVEQHMVKAVVSYVQPCGTRANNVSFHHSLRKSRLPDRSTRMTTPTGLQQIFLLNAETRLSSSPSKCYKIKINCTSNTIIAA